MRERGTLRFIGGGERDGGGQALGDLRGEARARQHGDLRRRQHLGGDLRHQPAGRLLDALGAQHERLAFSDERRELAGDDAHMLRRRHHQQHVAIGDLVEPRGRLDRLVELDARQEGLVAMLLVDVGDGLGLVRPDQHVAPGAPGDDGERGPPRPRTQYADRLQCHEIPRGIPSALEGEG